MKNSWTSEETDPRVRSLNESLVHVDHGAAFLLQFKRTEYMGVRRVRISFSVAEADEMNQSED